MSKLVAELFRRFFLALADLAAVNHHVVVAGDAIDPDRTEGKLVEAHRCTSPRVQALFLEVTTEETDQHCSTLWLRQWGQVTLPSSWSASARIFENVFLQAWQKNS